LPRAMEPRGPVRGSLEDIMRRKKCDSETEGRRAVRQRKKEVWSGRH
jgi:hypothetical protein